MWLNSKENVSRTIGKGKITVFRRGNLKCLAHFQVYNLYESAINPIYFGYLPYQTLQD